MLRDALPPVLAARQLAWRFGFGLLLGLCCAAAFGAELGDRDLAVVAPSEVGFDPAGIAALDAATAKLVADGELAGAITVVARRGKIAHFHTVGQRDIATGAPMAKDTIFRIHSMSKPITGVALMTFYDEGRFALDDPVSKFIPAFKGLKVAAGTTDDGAPLLEDATHEMTIRELVSHTAGLTYGFFSRSHVDTLYMRAGVLDNTSTLADMIGKLADIPLWAQPGTKWQYSVGVDVQGYLVEALAGKPFDEVLKERVFDPLGMTDTAFHVPKEKAGRLATIYRQARGKLIANPPDEPFQAPKLLSGGGGLFSTASDYIRFCEMLLGGGQLDGARVLKPETVALMHTNQLPETVRFIHPAIGAPGNTFGIDFAIFAEPDTQTTHPRAKGEYWWHGIGGTWFGINPNEDLAMVGMIQNMGGPGAKKSREQGKMLVYQALAD